MQLGEMQHFNNTPLGEMQLSPFNCLSLLDRDKFLELNLSLSLDKKAYLVAENYGEGIFIRDDILDNYYYKNEKLNYEINLNDDKFDNPDNCTFYDQAYILFTYCSMLSDGSSKIKGITDSVKAFYYDIEINNKRVFTE
ncbi:hypothetical protein H8356DRAFT_1431801 [Neocallimastix lanati (nom. inval.)]|nr:hypothetical protein H8356DRAFT_1431801 [Neocallimastix sp. JGI-2020a]